MGSSAATLARNNLRVFFNSRKPKPFWKQLQAIRQETSSGDYGVVCEIVENNPAYPFPGFGNTFPSDENYIPDSRYRAMRPLSAARELSFQTARLNYHSERLLACLNSLATINELIAASKYREAEEAVGRHKESFGLSFSILKKEFFIVLQQRGFAGLSIFYKGQTDSFQQTGWALLCRYIYDFVDPTNTPERAAPTWRILVDRSMGKGEWFARVLHDDVLTFGRDDADIASAALRVSSVSLLDSALFLWRKQIAHGTHKPVQDAYQKLDTRLRSVLEQRFRSLPLMVAGSYLLSDRQPGDEEVYRLCFLFDDIEAIVRFKCSIKAWPIVGPASSWYGKFGERIV